MKNLILVLLFAVSSVNAEDYDLEHLAEAIYFEARSEPLACQIIVAQVILNRVHQERYPDTIKEVIHQRNNNNVCQYSYFCDGKPDRLVDSRAEIVAYQAASFALEQDAIDFSEGADHYYAHDIVIPYWSRAMKNSFVCGGHTFGKLSW